MQMNPEQRIELGRKRIVNVLRSHGIATLRMLEQKISDAGPSPQRVDPHLLTRSRTELQSAGRLCTRLGTHGTQWHFLREADQILVERRFQELQAIHTQTEAHSFTLRMGQTAEIAVLRALQLSSAQFVGHFDDLDQHDDAIPYRKHDLDSISGRQIKGGQLDYVLFHPEAGPMGIEVKNIREWIYPDRMLMKALLAKCVQIDAVPVMIARRISYSTFSLLTDCGVIVHQFYNQLYPNADSALADQVRQKLCLGYFDVRVGNVPDGRLLRFFGQNLPSIAKRARQKFSDHVDDIAAFAEGRMAYPEFAARIRGRFGTDEDSESEQESEAQ